MSYEGYEQYLCTNGHYWTLDAITSRYGSYPKEMYQCTFCKAPAVWMNDVDQTNGCDDSHPECCDYVTLEVDMPVETHACSCGNVHAVKPPTYKIPVDKGRMIQEERRRNP